MVPKDNEFQISWFEDDSKKIPKTDSIGAKVLNDAAMNVKLNLIAAKEELHA